MPAKGACAGRRTEKTALHCTTCPTLLSLLLLQVRKSLKLQAQPAVALLHFFSWNATRDKIEVRCCACCALVQARASRR